MKLLFCKNCKDIVNLSRQKRTCLCGKTSGKYLNSIDAIYDGEGLPLGINNTSFSDAVRLAISKDLNVDFVAFTIDSTAKSFRKVNFVD